MVLTGLEDLSGLFELLKLLALGLQFLFRLGDLGFQLVGLLQDHLNGRFLLPRFASLELRRGRFRYGFRYWHLSSPSVAVVGIAPIARVSGWLLASPAARYGCRSRELSSLRNGP